MGSGQCFELGSRNEPKAERYLLRAGHLQSLTLLDGLNERSRFKQRVVRAGLQQRHAPAKDFGGEPPTLKIPPVNIRDLKLASIGRLQLRSHLDYLRVV